MDVGSLAGVIVVAVLLTAAVAFLLTTRVMWLLVTFVGALMLVSFLMDLWRLPGLGGGAPAPPTQVVSPAPAPPGGGAPAPATPVPSQPPPGGGAAPNPAPSPVAPAPPPAGTPVAAPAPLPPPSGGGECEGKNDYQLQNLIEVSSRKGYLIHVQFYRKGLEDFERESLLPSGRYMVKVPDWHGHVWELGVACAPQQALDRHVGPSIERRKALLVNTKGYVHWTTLVNEGLISVVRQFEPVPQIPASLSGSTPPPGGAAAPAPSQPGGGQPAACGDGKQEVRDPVKGTPFTPGPTNTWRVFPDAWTNEWANTAQKPQALGRLLVPPDQNPSLLVGGAYWWWPKECGSVANANYEKDNGKPKVSLDQLRTRGLVR